jgi:hypothetical protein
MAPLHAIEARFETWARNGEHLSEGNLRDVVTKIRQAVADTRLVRRGWSRGCASSLTMSRRR